MSKRQEVREKRRKKQRSQRAMLIVTIVGAALIIAAILILPSLKPLGEISMPVSVERGQVSANTMGDPNAPVVIEEFSDFGCSHCKRFSEETEPDIIEQYIASGQVYLIYSPFPLSPITFEAAEASFCASEQELFWEYHDILFANQLSSDGQPFSSRRLEAYAEAMGLDVDAFNDCVNDNRYRSDVQAAYNKGSAEGINSTPSFLINGKLVVGALPFEGFREEIEAALAAVE
jgi:protein-disulfide isomerase